MSLRQRLWGAGATAVGLTAGLQAFAWELGAPFWAHLGALVVGAAVGGLVAHGSIVAPYEAQLTALARGLRAGRLPDRLEPELDAVREAAVGQAEAHADAVAAMVGQRQAAWDILDSSPLAICTLGADGRITWTNRRFGETYRLRGAPVGRRPIEVVPLVELHEVAEALLQGAPRAERAATTEKLDLVVRGERLPNGAFVLRTEDVTAAREAERARTDFVANVSHELRTPVAAVLGYLDLLRSEGLPPDLAGLLDTAFRNAERLRDLFEDLLVLHRVEARRRELPLARQPLYPLLEAAIGPARDQAAFRDQTLDLACPRDLEARVNPDALGAMLANLVSNASNYSPRGAPIRVVAAQDGAEVRVDVIDRGVGIAEKHHERIFERFYRVDEARSRKAGGTGLGLAIVKHYALASGCRVSLQSREGEGSTFTLHLPAR